MTCSAHTSTIRHKKTLSALISLICCAGVNSALAQQKPALEEVLVTATKRPQNVQDIPLSVTSVTGEKLDEAGIENLADLTTLVPNIHFTQTGLSTQMRIRGIGSDNSQGFEQSVGVYVDGIFRGRAQMFRAPMFDMERVEVLRGPQSTLFGKNSIAGALDLITAKPTDQLTGSLTANYEAEYGATEVTSVVSGPLTDTLKARVALRKLDDSGYIHNTFKNSDEPEQDIRSGRLGLEWAPSDSVTLNYTGEYNTMDVTGRAIEISKDDPNPLGATFSQALQSMGQPGFDGAVNGERATDAPEFSDNTMASNTLKAEWDVNGYTVTSLTGAVRYNYLENCDCDFTPVSILDLQLQENYHQYSQELRIASPIGQKVEWLGGIFMQKYEQQFSDLLRVPADSFLVGLVTRSAGALQPIIANDFANTGVARQFEQESQAQAIFGQATINLTDDFRFVLGGRYTNETKTGNKELHIVDLVTNKNYNATESQLQGPLAAYQAPAIYASPAFKVVTEEAGGHKVSKQRDETAFNPLVVAQWDISNDISSYLSYTTGFKAGGFDPRSNQPIAFEFDEEKATAYEMGLKTTLSDRADINVAIFRTDYDNLQVSQFDGGVSFNVGNAKETRVQGLELDGRVAISNSLMATYGLSLLDFEYLDFKNGNCYFGQVGVDNNGDGIAECDYSGQSGVYTPDYTFNLGFDYRRNLTSNLEFAAIADAQFVDGHQVHVNLDPQGEIDAYTMLSLRLQIGGEHWHAALLGKNLLDEEVITYSANAPLSENTFKTNTYYSFVNRPRTVALEAAFKF